MPTRPDGLQRAWGLAILAVALTSCPKRVLDDLEPTLRPRTHAAGPRADVRGWFLRARVAEARGDVDEARRSWDWVLRLAPDDPWARMHHGAFLEGLGQRDEALRDYERALELDAELAAADLAAGRVLVVSGRDDEARPHLHRAVSADVSGEAYNLYARLLLRDADVDGAAAVLDSWLLRVPAPGPERFDRARLAILFERPGPAVDDLVASLDTWRADPYTAELLVTTSRRACRVGTVWRWAAANRVARRTQPAWRKVALELGRASADDQLVADAIGAMRAPDTGEVREGARALAAVGRIDEAIALVRDASVMDPAERRFHEAWLSLDVGRPADALAALDGWTGSPAAFRVRIDALLALGDLTGAREAGRAAREAFPDSGDVWTAAVRAEVGARDLTAALALIDASPLEPAWREVVRGRVLAELGEVEAADAALVAAGEAGETAGWRALATLRDREGDITGAIAAWDALVTADPRDVDAWLSLAALDPDRAPEAIDQALVADPCDPDALVAKAALQPPCAYGDLLARALDSAPLSHVALRAQEEAYVRCAAAQPDATTDSARGLRRLEETWYLMGVPEAVARVRAAREELEARR